METLLNKEKINSKSMNNVFLGDASRSYGTSYQQAHVSFENSKKEQHSKPEIGSNIKFGYDNPDKISSNQSTYISLSKAIVYNLLDLLIILALKKYNLMKETKKI